VRILGQYNGSREHDYCSETSDGQFHLCPFIRGYTLILRGFSRDKEIGNRPRIEQCKTFLRTCQSIKILRPLRICNELLFPEDVAVARTLRNGRTSYHRGFPRRIRSTLATPTPAFLFTLLSVSAHFIQFIFKHFCGRTRRFKILHWPLRQKNKKSCEGCWTNKDVCHFRTLGHSNGNKAAESEKKRRNANE
jgi:hypothetical protein